MQCDGIGAVAGLLEDLVSVRQTPVVGEACTAGVFGQMGSLTIIGIYLVSERLVHQSFSAASCNGGATLVRAQPRLYTRATGWSAFWSSRAPGQLQLRS